MFKWASDPIVNRFMPYNCHKSVEESKAWIASIAPEDYEFGFFLKVSGECIGSGSIGKDTSGAYNLGYNLNRAYWNQGYATEAGKALIAWAYEHLNARDFAAAHATANVASGRVIQKGGFQFEKYGRYGRFDGSEIYEASFYKMHLD